MIKYFYFFLLFSLLSCKEQNQNKDRVDDLKNICKYSQWLKIEEGEKGVLIEITSPIDKEKSYTIGINSQFETDIAIDAGEPLGVFSTTHIGMLAELNALGFIKATTSQKLISSEYVNNRIKSGQIKSFSENSNPDMESLVRSGIKLLIHSAFNGDYPIKNKLKKFKIETIPNFDWMESHPLGKAEWILLFGYLTGKQERAKERFKYIESEYLKLVKDSIQNSPIIMMGGIMGDYWISPASNSFSAKFIKDAGGNYIYSNEQGQGSLKLSLEKVIYDSRLADLWINPGFDKKSEILRSNPKLEHLSTLNNGRVFDYSHNANKYWEYGAIHPHLILADLIRIIRGEELELLHFYKEVL